MMVTTHRVIFESATSLPDLPDHSVDLVVTSPPYPMVAMWDEIFALQEPGIQSSLEANDGVGAFSSMHAVLDEVWRESARVLRPGGFVCINIGDATRTVGGDFRLYANHARITRAMERVGMHALPAIVWRKQTNAPTKFMGSGMLPSGAYVTLEHEYILVFRNGGKRSFASGERDHRRRSAFFWEERNQWFSDLWDLKGVRQRLQTDASRVRSGAFPFELAFRLINMYSLHGDTVMDPFVGTGTTMVAAVSSARN
ncbi:MAG TPA: site-specific DNA-methyltransferase, partial [Alkalispirochaeta sp.]|nr:site-specific DNA-methyltransferase [Alkalispirochaeta sp.]